MTILIGTLEYDDHEANIYLFKFNNRSTKRRSKICSKLTIKTKLTIAGKE